MRNKDGVNKVLVVIKQQDWTRYNRFKLDKFNFKKDINKNVYINSSGMVNANTMRLVPASEIRFISASLTIFCERFTILEGALASFSRRFHTEIDHYCNKSLCNIKLV